MLNPQTLSKTSRLRSRTRKVSHPINRDSSLQESNWKTEEPSQTTTFKRNLLSIWSSDSEEVCRSSLRLWLERPSHSMLNPQTPLKTSKLRSKIRKVSPQINKDSSSLESNLRMAEPFLTTTSKRSPPFTWSSDWEEASEQPSLAML